eukprot:TRINITY_DN5878_c0_g1_i1.p1 TRINITY_DN5878_c0_g1~~TRINITY_DN5878_c0_g1_i1.p1  ORF type:complete len:313 (+),score=72.11 TRINITY_DN5878_c0_g1_i1:125-1063(+)
MPNFKARPPSTRPPSSRSGASPRRGFSAGRRGRSAGKRAARTAPPLDTYPGLPGIDLPVAVRRRFLNFVEAQRAGRREVVEAQAAERTALERRLRACIQDLPGLVKLEANKTRLHDRRVDPKDNTALARPASGYPAGFRNSVIEGSTWDGLVRRSARHGGGDLFDSEAAQRIAIDLRESNERRALKWYRVSDMRAIWSPVEIAALMHHERRARRYYQKRLYAQHRQYLERLSVDLWACVDADGVNQTRRLSAMLGAYHRHDQSWPEEDPAVAGAVVPHSPCECFERYPKRGPKGWQRVVSPKPTYPLPRPED